jgi:hypothetical protein
MKIITAIVQPFMLSNVTHLFEEIPRLSRNDHHRYARIPNASRDQAK